MNESDLNNVRHGTSNAFRNKEREYVKYKIYDLETNSKDSNIRVV
jgi:hypothetical protein